MKLKFLVLTLGLFTLLGLPSGSLAQTGGKAVTIKFKSAGIGKKCKKQRQAKADAEGKAQDALEVACAKYGDEHGEICNAYHIASSKPYKCKGWKIGTTTLAGKVFDTAEGTYEGTCDCKKKPRDAFIQDEVIDDLIDIIIHDDPEFPYFE